MLDPDVGSSTPIDDAYRQQLKFAAAVLSGALISALMLWYIGGAIEWMLKSGDPPSGLEAFTTAKTVEAPTPLAVAPFIVAAVIALFAKGSATPPLSEQPDPEDIAKRAMINDLGFLCCLLATLTLSYLLIAAVARGERVVDLVLAMALVVLCSFLAVLYERSEEMKLRTLEQIEVKLAHIAGVLGRDSVSTRRARRWTPYVSSMVLWAAMGVGLSLSDNRRQAAVLCVFAGIYCLLLAWLREWVCSTCQVASLVSQTRSKRLQERIVGIGTCVVWAVIALLGVTSVIYPALLALVIGAAIVIVDVLAVGWSNSSDLRQERIREELVARERVLLELRQRLRPPEAQTRRSWRIFSRAGALVGRRID